MAERALSARASASVWSESEWASFDRRVRRRARGGAGDDEVRTTLVRACRRVMRTYTTSFFIVSRFLPRRKRDRVELIYAAVRYPDEIVDSFPLDPGEKLKRLDEWEAAYERGLACRTLRDMLDADVSSFLAGFVAVVGEASIPRDHYRSFLSSMRLDARPRPYETLDDLIESYIYGSAIVVGYFLAHVYGAENRQDFSRALECARDLAVALQLTNFLRDVAEDRRRGRIYLPQDRLRAEGLEGADVRDATHHAAFGRVVKALAAEAADYYARSARNLDAFSADCRPAIKACMDVYGLLNRRILDSDNPIARRESVPLLDKLRPLPPSKYWRIPLAWILP